MSAPFEIVTGPGPLVAAAVHDGHAVHPDTLPHFALEDAGRLREEDPFTGEFTDVTATRILGQRSRFEVDLNRPRERAVYATPDDAWGLTVWKDGLPADIKTRSHETYDTFYDAVEKMLSLKIQEYGSVVVFDLHSYNHKRDGPDGPIADPDENPEVNIGTGTLDREKWGPLVDRFMADLEAGAIEAGLPALDVRENVKFQGGHFSQWIHQTFGSAVCVIAVEFKKTFMDEWSGAPDRTHLDQLHRALASTVPGVLEERDAVTS